MVLVRTPNTYAADAAVTLAADITSSDLAITLTNDFVFKSGYTSGQFAIEIHDLGTDADNSEWILLDDYPGALSLTVNASGRGYENTTAHAHVTGDPVRLVLLEADLIRVGDGRSISPLDVTLTEESTPSNPPTGEQTLFVDSADHLWKTVDHSGTVTEVGSGSSSLVISTADPEDTAATADPGASTTDVSAFDHVHQLGDHDHTASAGDGGTIPASSVTGLAAVATSGDYADLTGTPAASTQHYAVIMTGASPPAPVVNDDNTGWVWGLVDN